MLVSVHAADFLPLFEFIDPSRAVQRARRVGAQLEGYFTGLIQRRRAELGARGGRGTKASGTDNGRGPGVESGHRLPAVGAAGSGDDSADAMAGARNGNCSTECNVGSADPQHGPVEAPSATAGVTARIRHSDGHTTFLDLLLSSCPQHEHRHADEQGHKRQGEQEHKRKHARDGGQCSSLGLSPWLWRMTRRCTCCCTTWCQGGRRPPPPPHSGR